VRRMGKRFEYKVRDKFREVGFSADRVPVSGVAPAVKGDVVVRLGDIEVYFECKRREKGFSELMEWLDKADRQGVLGVVVGLKRKRSFVVIDLEKFVDFLRGFIK
jgi:Holliday junction resolvase